MGTSLDPRAAKSAGGTSQFGRFFLPGPTEVRPDVLAAMNRPMISHRGAAIESLIGRIAPRLQQVFRTTDPVCAVTSSATGLMEAGVRNTVRSRILCLVNGAFSARFHKAAVNSGIAADKLEVEFGQVHTPEMVVDKLKGGQYDVVTMVHSETSTGALNPIRELTAAAHSAGDVVVVIDTVSSMAAAPIETAAWDIDYILTGSQKAFALPPGLAFYSANNRVLERARAPAADDEVRLDVQLPQPLQQPHTVYRSGRTGQADDQALRHSVILRDAWPVRLAHWPLSIVH